MVPPLRKKPVLRVMEQRHVKLVWEEAGVTIHLPINTILALFVAEGRHVKPAMALEKCQKRFIIDRVL
jgi:hypothetical protein